MFTKPAATVRLNSTHELRLTHESFCSTRPSASCTHCNAVPEQVVDRKAMIAIVRQELGCPTLGGPDPHTLARPEALNVEVIDRLNPFG